MGGEKTQEKREKILYVRKFEMKEKLKLFMLSRLFIYEEKDE